MLNPRLTVFLTFEDRKLIKTKKFQYHRYLGDPLNAVRIFNEKYVDELFLADIGHRNTDSGPDFDYLEILAAECRIPLCYAGRVNSVADAERLVSLGIEKIGVGRAALRDKGLVCEISDVLGKQSLALVLDVKKETDGRYFLVEDYLSGRSEPRDLRAIIDSGILSDCGELIVVCVDRDGLKIGFDLDLARSLAADASITLPVTLAGGASGLADFQDLGKQGDGLSGAASSMFVFKGRLDAVLLSYPDLKRRGLGLRA
jgi:cyclase